MAPERRAMGLEQNHVKMSIQRGHHDQADRLDL